MPILDFTEIPEAHIATGQQDAFELFTREFLAFMGYVVERDPDRGADGGRDLIVAEIRSGVGGQTAVRWLVSCKHKAHSGKSVQPGDEVDILGRVESKRCQGFIAFYSTIPSSGLGTRLEECTPRVEVQRFDSESIERYLLQSSQGLELAARFFPKSIERWRTENPQPAKIFSDQGSLHCQNCERDLLAENTGIVVAWKESFFGDDERPDHTVDFYWCCKGNCDQVLLQRFKRDHPESHAGDVWEDIPDIRVPTIFIRWVIATFNELRSNETFTDHAYDQFRVFMLTIFPYVARDLTTMEKEQLMRIRMLPDFLGGF
jgi:hypothetical protein